MLGRHLRASGDPSSTRAAWWDGQEMGPRLREVTALLCLRWAGAQYD